jgi:hypothetical protein
MSFQIPENMVQQYGNNFRILYQQRQSRLRPWCQIEAGIVGQSKSVERMGKAEAYDITSRHTDTKFVEVPHSRRWIDLQDKGWAELIDKLDKVRLLADPMAGYSVLANSALNRQMDDIVLTAARGNARTNAGLSVLPSTQKIAVGSASMTLAKLAGIEAAQTRVVPLVGQNALAVRRYDRDGVRRIHCISAGTAIRAQTVAGQAPAPRGRAEPMGRRWDLEGLRTCPEARPNTAM